MSDLRGKCQCGAVTFSATPKAVDQSICVDVCHCRMCRRILGGPSMAVELEGAPRIDDETALSVYRSSDWAERVFCKNCGSNLFYRLQDGSMHIVQAGALDEIPDARFCKEIFIDEKPDFYNFAENTEKLTAAQVREAFGLV